MAEITVDQITEKTLNGNGIFDCLMQVTATHLRHELTEGRITVTDYSKMYMSAMEQAMQQSIAFALGKQQADKQAELLDKQALLIVEQIAGATKDNLIKDKQLEVMDAEIALTNQRENLTQQEVVNLTAQKLKTDAEVSYIGKQEDKLDQDILTAVQETIIATNTAAKIIEDTALVVAQTSTATSQGNLIVQQSAKVQNETSLVQQKRDTEKAQIMDVVEGVPVAGILGAQKALYNKQADGFTRNAEQKAAKIFVDTWSVRHSNEPSANPETSAGITDADIKAVMDRLKSGVTSA